MKTRFTNLASRGLPHAAVAMLAVALVAAGCGGGSEPQALNCDDGIKTAFKPDANTTVVAVKAFKKGDALLLSGTPTPSTAVAANDICMVKLNVGPGNPGPADAPSTSAGIGIEVWLPILTNWNQRIHALGGGGWQGGVAGSATAIASTAAAAIAGVEGAVSSTTDTGHAITGDAIPGTGPGTGSFAMNPDGTINKTLWTDFAQRSIHEQAVKTKALTKAFYGSPAKYAYWEGGSKGGQQAFNLIQNHPNDYDGLIANYPAINWTRLITSELYPQIVYQRDLDAPPTSDQLALVSNASIAACDVVGGKHLGYILDPSSCKYDPTQDLAVLCPSDGGTNSTAACVTKVQAQAINKIWYGMTADGSVVDPAVDNGWGQAATSNLLGSGNYRWFGLTRGTTFASPIYVGLGNPATEFPIASDMVALELQNPAIAGPGFKNATANGQSQWKNLSYAQLANAYDRGVALQPEFGGINTDNPDLSAFMNRGGKVLTWHGLADELVVPQGTVNYYHRVAAQMGGMANVQSFFRLYLAPGLGHGTPNGTSNPAAVIPNFSNGQMYAALTAWVEKGTAPDQMPLQVTSGGATRSMNLCVYPKKITYLSGDPAIAASYACQ